LFDIFAKMMDKLQEERKMYEARHAQTQKLLAQATQDIMHLAAKNAELEVNRPTQTRIMWFIIFIVSS
jgi:hypothetical protein